MFLQLNSDDFPFFCFQDWTSVAKVSLFSTLIFFAQFFSLFSMIWRRLREASLKNMPQPFAPPPHSNGHSGALHLGKSAPNHVGKGLTPKIKQILPQKVAPNLLWVIFKEVAATGQGYLGTRVLGYQAIANAFEEEKNIVKICSVSDLTMCVKIQKLASDATRAPRGSHLPPGVYLFPLTCWL